MKATTSLLPDISDESIEAQSLVEKPRLPIHTTVLPVAAVVLDDEIRRDFLGSDIEVICACAAKVGSTLLITVAGQSLEQREAAFGIWRKRHLEKLAVNCSAVTEFLSIHKELHEKFADGTIDLLVLDRLMHDEAHSKNQETLLRLQEQKAALLQGVNANCVDIPLGHWPQILVVRGDSQMKLFKNQAAGKAWGHEGGAGFYLWTLADGMRMFMPEE